MKKNKKFNNVIYNIIKKYNIIYINYKYKIK